MQSILEQITDWLKSMIISGIMGNLSGMFDSVNQQVGQIAGDVGTTPANFSPAVFSMIRNISESVILPIAGMVLTFIACYELIQMLIEHNNLANFETWTFFKWVFKTFLAVTLISNTFNITMAVFDVAQQVISRSGGLISGSTSVSDATLTAMQATLEGMDLGPLLGLYLQTFVVQVTMLALSAIIFVIVYVVANSEGEPLSYTQFKRLWQYIVTRTVKERSYYRYENGKRVKHTVKPVLGERAAHNGKVVYSLDFEVTPHLLRHTYITNLIHASVDPKTVQYLAGHENSKITMDIYAKAKYNRPDELAGILEDTFTLWDAE